MDLFEAINDRKSIRRYKQTAVPDEDISTILEAGMRAPSANNSQPWSFLVIRDRALLRDMAAAVREMLDRMVPHAESEKQAQRLTAYKSTYYVFFEQAPAMIAVFMEDHEAGTDRLLARMGYSAAEVRRLRPNPGIQSVSAAVQNMLLAIHALGYGSCWMTGPLVAQEAFERLLGFGKDRYIAALLPIGVPDEDPPSRNRKPLDQVSRVIT